MAKKTKTKAWVKGLIAVAVIAVIGGLGYYGANGEMFQGKLKLDRPSAKNVKTVDRVENVRLDKKTDRVIQPFTVDGVQDAYVKEIAQPIELEKLAVDGDVVYTTEKVALSDDLAISQKDVVYTTEKVDYAVTTEKLAVDQDNVALDAGTLDKVVIDQDNVASTISNVALGNIMYIVNQPSTGDMEEGSVDDLIMRIRVENNNIGNVFVNQITVFEDGGGLNNYELNVSGIGISSNVGVETMFLGSLNKNVRKITFNFDSSYEIPANSARSFDIRANVIGGESFVAHTLDTIATDKGVKENMNYDFASFSRNILSAF